jgi:hypothetical protein
MADIDGNSNVDKMMEFRRTMELRVFVTIVRKSYQQKWANELGEEEWRDIPLVISE